MQEKFRKRQFLQQDLIFAFELFLMRLIVTKSCVDNFRLLTAFPTRLTDNLLLLDPVTSKDLIKDLRDFQKIFCG